MGTRTLSLRDLADAVRLSPRTIRSYIERELLPPPRGAGRAAHYDLDHLARLKAVRVLHEIDGLALDEIRRRLLMATRSDIARISSRFDDLDQPHDLWDQTVLSELTSAVERDSALREEADEPGGDDPRSGEASEEFASLASPAGRIARPSDRAMFHVRERGEREAPGPVKPPRRGRSELMTRIPITPDIDIVVRGEHGHEQLRRMERLADYLRDLLRRGGP